MVPAALLYPALALLGRELRASLGSGNPFLESKARAKARVQKIGKISKLLLYDVHVVKKKPSPR